MRMQRGVVLAALLASAAGASTAAPAPADYAADARALDAIIAANYAYLDRFDGKVPTSARLDAERDAVRDDDALLRYAENKIAALADHHAITGSGFRDDWALVPSFSDLWIVADARGYVIESVKADSPAAAAGIAPGDRLERVGDQAIDTAIADYWRALGFEDVRDAERRSFAARILAAGRRDRPRHLEVRHGAALRAVDIPNLYTARAGDRPPVTASTGANGAVTLRFNDSLGNSDTIAAFDAEMAKLKPGTRLVLDLSDTGSGGDSLIARAVMGWFVDRPRFYQMHRLVADERETGIARQWVEQVLPRPGKHFAGKVSVRVSRWTGSMGEGLAIGFMALGVPVCGGPMAGLRGAIYDFTLPSSGLTVKLPAERLHTVQGVPRETVSPRPCR